MSEESKSLLENSNVPILPGDCILRVKEDLVASSGTYIRNGYIFASIAGFVQIVDAKEDDKLEMEGKTNAEVDGENPPSLVKRIVSVVSAGTKKIPYLEPGSIVTCRIIRITATFAKCSIHCIEDYILKQPYTGVIRIEDIRNFDRDRVNINKCFRPGDIVLAKVLTTGENHLFRLTTAAPELGVVIATNDWNEPLIPITLTEMLCKRTFSKEPRKVAKIDLIS